MLLDLSTVARPPDSPLGSLLVEHTATAFNASDGVAALQRELGAAVSADVQHGKAFGLDGAARNSRVACARSAGALGGNLVALSRHVEQEYSGMDRLGVLSYVLACLCVSRTVARRCAGRG